MGCITASRRTLVIAVAVALGSLGAYQRIEATSPLPEQTHRPESSIPVTSCADDGSPGTLRYVIGHAPDLANVDMTQLSCSLITLEAGQIEVSQQHLQILGGNQTIDAHRASRVFRMGNSGAEIRDLNIENGYVKYDQLNEDAKGGCVLTMGNVVVLDVTMTGCGAASPYAIAAGGAIFSYGFLSIYDSTVSNSGTYGLDAFGGAAYSVGNMFINNSTVSGNSARAIGTGSTGYAAGGGVYACGQMQPRGAVISGNLARADDGIAFGGGVVANGIYSFSESLSITGNTASSPLSSGGGFVTRGYSYLYAALVAGNQAVDNAAGVVLPSARDGGGPNLTQVVDVTISQNISTTGSSAVFASEPLYLVASTIAFNQAAGQSAGLYLYPGGDATIISTIISNNASTGGGAGYDLVSRASIIGDHDLVMAASAELPPDTIRNDPLLQALADNGGPTLTHALIAGSPAVDAGRVAGRYNIPSDQRLQGYPRNVGSSPDIGAFELQTQDRIFGNGFDP